MPRDATAWTTKQVLDLAPDAAGARAAHRLARPSVWTDLGSNDSLLWGKCQGSGKEPYQVTVDRSEPAFRCTCPSRKQPCKHAVALLLLWVETKGTFTGTTSAPPPYERPAKRAKTSAGEQPRDPEAQAKRTAERMALMSAGIDELELWLFDLARSGLAAARRRPLAEFDAMGARLVDSQLPGLGDRVRYLPAVFGRDSWADDVLAEIGRWYLVIRAWRRRDDLDEDTIGDLRTVIGWPRRTEEILAGRRVTDRWFVLGRRLGDDGRIVSQRTWLQGIRSGVSALLLDFAASGTALRRPGLVGSYLDAEVALYPGAEPARAILTGDEVVSEEADGLPDAAPIRRVVDHVAHRIADNPWIERVPVSLAGVAADADVRHLVDGSGAALPLSVSFEPWTLLALTAGRPTDVFGEWQRGTVHPLSVVVDGRILSL